MLTMPAPAFLTAPALLAAALAVQAPAAPGTTPQPPSAPPSMTQAVDALTAAGQCAQPADARRAGSLALPITSMGRARVTDV